MSGGKKRRIKRKRRKHSKGVRFRMETETIVFNPKSFVDDRGEYLQFFI